MIDTKSHISILAIKYTPQINLEIVMDIHQEYSCYVNFTAQRVWRTKSCPRYYLEREGNSDLVVWSNEWQNVCVILQMIYGKLFRTGTIRTTPFMRLPCLQYFGRRNFPNWPKMTWTHLSITWWIEIFGINKVRKLYSINTQRKHFSTNLFSVCKNKDSGIISIERCFGKKNNIKLIYVQSNTNKRELCVRNDNFLPV